VRRSDRFTQLALAASGEALGQAGLDPPGEHAEAIGCVIGTGIGGIATIEREHSVLRDDGADRVSVLAVPLMMANAAAGVVAMQFGLGGQSFGCSSACASGAHAIGMAARLVACGDAEIVVAGGTESALTPLATAAFARMDATSTSGISRPFDRRRDGFVMGEGAASLVLESEQHANERGAEVLGWLVGYGATSDAHHLTAPQPSGEGASRAIELALKDAGAEPEEVAYVNAHGTSTPLNDASETAALKSALGERASEVQISALKSAIGHTLGAAGAIEALATLLVLREQVVPPTLALEEPDEDCDLDYVPLEAQPLANGDATRIGLSNSFGFGGHNAVLCLQAP
jgi:3-oxoacyl-[acyl-carrier-protein] synthase II